MIIFLRSADANPDPRLQKYIDFITEKKINFKVIAWDRDLCSNGKENYLYFKKSAKYGSGIKNIISLVLFNIFILKYLSRNIKNIHVIHACDFDTILPAILVKLLTRKKVIYDIFDWYVDSRNITNRQLKTIILLLESFCLKKSDVTIICEEERKKQLNFQPNEIWVLPNIPFFQNNPEFVRINNNKVIISYVGVFTQYRGLEKIIEFVKVNQNNYELHIAGVGELEPQLKEATKGCSSIIYYGKVAYNDGLKIMYNSDIIFAIYEKKIPNHIYAAPNKYYEGLFLGRPILTTINTNVGNKTMKYHTGFVIDEAYEDLNTFFNKKNLKTDMKEVGINGKNLWNKYYSNYVKSFMENNYYNFVSK